MEMLIGGKQLYYDDLGSGHKRPKKYHEWEFAPSTKERMSYGRALLEQMESKCKDVTVTNVMLCFAPVLTEAKFDRLAIVAELTRAVPLGLKKIIPNVVLLCTFLDARGDKCPMPGDKVTKATNMTELLNTLIDMAITRLKNYMPNKCGTCRSWYSTPFGRIPDVVCGLCSRGRHDCTPVPARSVGEKLHWFCPDCGIIMKEEFYGDRHNYVKEEDKEKNRKQPKRLTPITESISSHVKVVDCTDEELYDFENDSVHSIMWDSDRESVGSLSESEYDTDNYEYFQQVHEQEQLPARGGVRSATVDREGASKRKGLKKEPLRRKDVDLPGLMQEIKKKRLDFDSGSQFGITEEEVIRAISMIDCDTGLNFNNPKKSVPGITLVMTKDVMCVPIKGLISVSMKEVQVPVSSKKANVYRVMKGIKELLN